MMSVAVLSLVTIICVMRSRSVGLKSNGEVLQQASAATQILGADRVPGVEVEPAGVGVAKGEDHHRDLDDARRVHRLVGANGNLAAGRELLRVERAVRRQGIEPCANERVDVRRCGRCRCDRRVLPARSDQHGERDEAHQCLSHITTQMTVSNPPDTAGCPVCPHIELRGHRCARLRERSPRAP